MEPATTEQPMARPLVAMGGIQRLRQQRYGRVTKTTAGLTVAYPP